MPILRFSLAGHPEDLTYVLDGARITIGRGPDNTIQVPDRSVSAHHAELVLVNGHYRLHDLESTNLTSVDGQPVSDFHLHGACQIRFGNVEAEFSPDLPPNFDGQQAELAPTQAEIDFLKRDNRDLQEKVANLQRQIEILGEVPLMPLDHDQSHVPAETHRRVLHERDALRRENNALKREAANFKRDIDEVLRDRDALRQAWMTAKADLAGIPS